MKIANSTGYFARQETDPLRMFCRMRDLGYEAADWDIADTASALYLDDDAAERECRRVREGAEAAGVEIYQAHGPWPTDDTTPESRETGWKHFHRAVYLCSLVGCPRLVIHPQMPFGWGGTEDPDVAYRFTLDLLCDLMPDCETYGVTVCLENMPFLKQRISTMDRIAEVVRAVGNPHAAICLDTGHVNVFDNADLGDAVRQAGDLLAALHVHDNRDHRDMHLLPWHGTADWEHFIEALAASPYRGPMTLETAGGIPAGLPLPLREKAERFVADTARYLADRVEQG